MTPLDTAHAAMLADPEDDAARLRYYRVLADTELFLLLVAEAAGARVNPQVFALEQGPVVLAFDTEERLAEFTGMPAPYAALPGRVVAAQLAGQGTGLGVNLGTPERAWLMAPHAVDWLADVLGQGPEELRGRPRAVRPAGALTPALAEAIDVAVAGAGGLAVAAVVAAAVWADNRQGLILAYIGAAPAAEAPLARALAEALAFSGLEGGAIDVVFLAPDDPVALHLREIGRRVPLPAPVAPRPAPAAPAAPGMDPARPPRLR